MYEKIASKNERFMYVAESIEVETYFLLFKNWTILLIILFQECNKVDRCVKDIGAKAPAAHTIWRFF